MVVERHRIDDEYKENTRPNRSKKDLIRRGFRCVKCGHSKAFVKNGSFECSRCKNVQKSILLGWSK